jgi:hypothetical protein
LAAQSSTARVCGDLVPLDFWHFLTFFPSYVLSFIGLHTFSIRALLGASVIFVLGCFNFSDDLIGLSLVKK